VWHCVGFRVLNLHRQNLPHEEAELPEILSSKLIRCEEDAHENEVVKIHKTRPLCYTGVILKPCLPDSCSNVIASLNSINESEYLFGAEFLFHPEIVPKTRVHDWSILTIFVHRQLRECSRKVGQLLRSKGQN
jgi:hypothetical protein